MYGENIDADLQKTDENYCVLLPIYRYSWFQYSLVIILLQPHILCYDLVHSMHDWKILVYVVYAIYE